jgi:hypothetical protein
MDILTGIYANIFRQIPAKLIQNFTAGHGAVAVEIRYLSPGMGTGICPSASGDFDLLVEDSAQCLFQFSLNGVIDPSQSLPAPVPGTVIANVKPQIPQAAPTPLWLPVRYLPRTGTHLCDRIPERDHEHSA